MSDVIEHLLLKEKFLGFSHEDCQADQARKSKNIKIMGIKNEQEAKHRGHKD